MAAPLAAGGPPGWVAWAVVGTALTVGAVWGGAQIYEASQANSRTRSGTGTVARTDTRTCEDCNQRPYSIRVHAQGTDMGGTSGSTLGAAALSRTGTPFTAAEGIGLSNATWVLLSRRQQSVRTMAKTRLERFVSSCPPSGFLGQRSFPATDRTGGKRYDVDSYGPSANFIS